LIHQRRSEQPVKLALNGDLCLINTHGICYLPWSVPHVNYSVADLLQHAREWRHTHIVSRGKLVMTTFPLFFGTGIDYLLEFSHIHNKLLSIHGRVVQVQAEVQQEQAENVECAGQ
jgi:hypothetical protein